MDLSLPEHLEPRVRVVVGPTERPATATPGLRVAGSLDLGSQSMGPGSFVLYWMHHALRAHENPALDVAICVARREQLPLLVYHALSEDYPYASNRHHAFILQGARDVQREMAKRGIAYVFHLQRNGHRGAYLRDLVRAARVLVTEEMPVQPIVGWLERLTSLTSTPILSVDASCVATPRLVPKCYTRAFEFRRATRHLLESHVGCDYVEQVIDGVPWDHAGLKSQLPFESLDLQDVSLAELIAQCRIDHTIGPVADTPGGTRAGYARWEAFCKSGLAQYARLRNDASTHQGVSRMSAYLHYGMVSPFRIAREAKQAGAEKFLDELLIWRELAFHFCWHRGGDVDTLAALPDWARATLHAHRSDVREASYSCESFSRALTHQTLWNECQRSLLRHGELHNNLRMTWGKAVLQWTSSPERALQTLVDLNHRYALDGRDPSSYGGILWCLGQFDRPFEPEQPVLGSVRPREIAAHAQRLNRHRYQQIVERPIAAKLPSVAIVGAGLAGLVAARTLQDHGLAVRVLEKSPQVGGRLATRELGADLQFDHGAQYFTARDPRFAKCVRSWMHDDLAQPWLGRIVEVTSNGTIQAEKHNVARYVGTPSMNHIARHLARDLDVALDTPVHCMRRSDNSQWELLDSHDQVLHRSDVVIVNCPAPQAHRLLVGHSDLAASVQSVQMQPCWAVMLRTSQVDGVPYDAAMVNDSVLAWIARNSSKPQRTDRACTWLLHATARWSSAHLESSVADVTNVLLAAFSHITHCPLSSIDVCQAHLWRYAIPSQPLEVDCLWDSVANLGACGDWCGGPRVEGAYLSGCAMAGSLVNHFTIDRAAAAAAASVLTQTTLF